MSVKKIFICSTADFKMLPRGPRGNILVEFGILPSRYEPG